MKLNKFKGIRARTLLVTILILVALVFYYLVNVTLGGEINWVDFFFMGTASYIMHLTYFPDGKHYGEEDKVYQGNKMSYNEKASAINDRKLIGELREYCKVEYERRKKAYTQTECDVIGITIEEFEALKEQKISDLKNLIQWEHDGKMINFTKSQRKRLIALITKPIPIEHNTAETIMGGVENNGYKAIKDKSIGYEKTAHILKFLRVFVISLIVSYIGYTIRQGIDITVIVGILIFLVTIISTAVFSFSTGETAITTYKNNYYIELANYIDGFEEWYSKRAS